MKVLPYLKMAWNGLMGYDPELFPELREEFAKVLINPRIKYDARQLVKEAHSMQQQTVSEFVVETQLPEELATVFAQIGIEDGLKKSMDYFKGKLSRARNLAYRYELKKAGLV